MRDNSFSLARSTSARPKPPLRRAAWLAAALACLAGLGCDDDKPETAPAATAEAAKQEVAPGGAIETLAAPDEVIVYGGADDLTAMAEKLKKAYPALGPSLDPAALSAAFVQRYKITDPSVIELSKPVRFAVIDPKNASDPMVLLVPTKGKEAFEKALPADKKADDAGNTWSLKAGGRTAYVNMIDQWAVFAGSPEAFKKHKDFLVKLAGATLSQPAMIVVDANHTTQIFGKDLETGVAGLKEEMKGQPGVTGGSLAGLESLFDGFVEVAKQADKLVLQLAPIDDGALLKVDVHPKKGSDLAKTFDELGQEKLDLLSKAPKDAPLVVAWSMNPDSASELTKGLWRWSLQFMGGADSDPKFAEAMETYWKATNGDVLAVAHELEGKPGLRFSMIFGVRDAEKAREAQKTLRGLYDDPAVKSTYKDMGLEMKYQDDAYKIGDVSVSTITTDMKNDDLAKLGPGAGIFNSMLTQHFAIGDELGVIGYGTDGKEAVTAWLEEKVAGGFEGTDPAKKALEYAAPGTFLLAYAQASPLASAFKGDEKPGTAGKRGLVLSAGAKGGVLHLVVDVPQEQVAALQQAMGGMAGAL